MKKSEKRFVKSADTNVSVQESMESIKALVRRHGASGFGVLENYKTGLSTVEFVLTEGNDHIPIKIPVNVGRVFSMLYPGYKDPKKNDESVQDTRREQAERTAWRQLYLIIDATLTAHALGVMSISDAFLAHTMIVHDDGKSERMGDYVERVSGVLAPGVRALLGAGNGTH